MVWHNPDPIISKCKCDVEAWGYRFVFSSTCGHLPEWVICSRLQAAASPALLSGAVLISMATAVPASRRVSRLQHYEKERVIWWQSKGKQLNGSPALTLNYLNNNCLQTCPSMMSIRACRIICTVGHPCSLFHTRGAISLDNSWNICKHT